MRISIILIIFLVLFNGWAGLMQEYNVDDHVGITAETGNPDELDQAADKAQDIQTGGAVGGTLLGFYNSLLGTVEDIMTGIQPGVQMLVNVAPPGAAEDFIIWISAAIPFIIAVDILAYARGVNL